VNIYRLIKAGLTDDDQRVFTEKPESDTGGDYQNVLLLLSISTGS
jgi:hypothetical protein